jgi:hypothetical protein
MRAVGLLAPLLAGCGIYINSTVARTLPFHAHGDDIADYPQLDTAALTAPPRPLAAKIPPFIPYYPRPAVVQYQANGPEGTVWSFEESAGRPEDDIPWLLGGSTGPSAEGVPTLYGVVTDFQWYRDADGALAGGRIATHLTVVAPDGAVLYEGEHTTKGRARAVQFLYLAHVQDWLRDQRFFAAIPPTGGAQ